MPCSLAECRLAPFAHAYSGFMSNAVVNSRATLLAFSGVCKPAAAPSESDGCVCPFSPADYTPVSADGTTSLTWTRNPGSPPPELHCKLAA